MDNNIPLLTYPRPQFKRDSYISLNGYWDYAIISDKDVDNFKDEFQGKILVPFSPESKTSGVSRQLQPNETLIYQREIKITEGFLKDFLLINFLAIDQISDIYFNDKLMLHHIGGYLPFQIKIDKENVKEKNILKIVVKDYSDTSFYSRGKQKLNRGGIWYTAQSGIYFPVFMESVNKNYIANIKITPDIDKSSVNIFVDSPIESTIILNKQKYVTNNKKVVIKIPNPHLWSPEDPFLYDIKIINEADEISSYFAMRKFSKGFDGNHYRLYLNNKPYFMKGVLDQGYYPDTLYTPKEYSDYYKDIKLVKDLGYNTIRKHIKIEIPIWYYYADILGIIVWQDFVNGGTKYKFSTIAFPLVTKKHHKDNKYKKFARKDFFSRELAGIEMIETINHLYNTPSIGLWTIFNEGWGQFDAKSAYETCYILDPTRIYDHASGWHDQGISETKSLHVYFSSVKMPKEKTIKNRAVILSECGGYNLKIEGHTYSMTNFGYKQLNDKESLMNEYQTFVNRDILANIPKGLSAFIYTQLSDVEDELNGLITYDRKVIKVDIDDFKKINDKINY